MPNKEAKSHTMNLKNVLKAIASDANRGILSGFRAGAQLDNLLKQLDGHWSLSLKINAKMIQDPESKLYHDLTIDVSERPLRKAKKQQLVDKP